MEMMEKMEGKALTSPVRCVPLAVLHSLGPHLRASFAANVHIDPRKNSATCSRCSTPDRLTSLKIMVLVIVQVQGCRSKRSKYPTKAAHFTVLQ